MNPSSWLELPATMLLILAAVLLLVTLVQGVACRRHLRYRRRLRASGRFLLLLVFLALTALVAGTGYTLRGYRLLSGEVPVMNIQAQKLAPEQWQLQLGMPDGEQRSVRIDGDAWRAEAVVLKWKLPGVLAGLPPVYRFDRLSGRYTDPYQASTTPPTVVTFEHAGNYDLFRLALAHHDWLPMVDTVYGSGAYMPLHDGATYRVSLMRTGALVARRDARVQRDQID